MKSLIISFLSLLMVTIGLFGLCLYYSNGTNSGWVELIGLIISLFVGLPALSFWLKFFKKVLL